MRYILTFRSIREPQKRTRRLSQKEGEQIVRQLADGKNIVVHGDFYNANEVESVRQINTQNGFPADYVEQQKRQEMSNEEERVYLDSISSPQLNENTR